MYFTGAYKERGTDNEIVTRAIQYNGFENEKTINFLCNNIIKVWARDINYQLPAERDWIIETPMRGHEPRTFSIMSNSKFHKKYEITDARFILSGGKPCCK